jgi:thymidylate synthase
MTRDLTNVADLDQQIVNQTYRPLYQANQVICGHGSIVVVTGWTPAAIIAKQLDPDYYAAIGNLYSPTRGLSPLLRNILANPYVSHVLCLGCTKEDDNAGGVQALYDFFVKGFEEGFSDLGKPCWVVNSQIRAYIDIEIPSEALEDIRRNVSCILNCSVADCVTRTLAITKIKTHWAYPRAYPEPEFVPSKALPASPFAHRVEAKTIAQAWVKILHRITTSGIIRQSSYGLWQELIDLVVVIADEPEGLEFANYLPITPMFFKNYLAEFSDPANLGKVSYTYGQRIRSHFGVDQVEQVIEKLNADAKSGGDFNCSNAVISLWDPSVDGKQTKNTPCLNHIWFRVVKGQLTLTATFRSNDMYSAWVANTMALRCLQIEVAQKLDISAGELITISQSAHIYQDDWHDAQAIVKRQYRKLCKPDFADPVGSFIIESNVQEIIVHQTTAGNGELVNTYRGKSPLTLVREIAADNPTIAPGHLGYLGIELEKAYRLGYKYKQDK